MLDTCTDVKVQVSFSTMLCEFVIGISGTIPERGKRGREERVRGERERERERATSCPWNTGRTTWKSVPAVQLP